MNDQNVKFQLSWEDDGTTHVQRPKDVDMERLIKDLRFWADLWEDLHMEKKNIG